VAVTDIDGSEIELGLQVHQFNHSVTAVYLFHIDNNIKHRHVRVISEGCRSIALNTMTATDHFPLLVGRLAIRDYYL